MVTLVHCGCQICQGCTKQAKATDSQVLFFKGLLCETSYIAMIVQVSESLRAVGHKCLQTFCRHYFSWDMGNCTTTHRVRSPSAVIQFSMLKQKSSIVLAEIHNINVLKQWYACPDLGNFQTIWRFSQLGAEFWETSEQTKHLIFQNFFNTVTEQWC